MKISDHSKRILAITGGVIVCVVLITAIGGRFQKQTVAIPVASESVEASESLVVKTEAAIETEQEITTSETAGKQVPVGAVQNETLEVKTAEKEETKVSLPVQTDREEQAIQPAPEKFKEPPKEVLENPEVKPNGETVVGTVEAVEHENVERPSELPTQAEPQGGDTQNGQIYVPGFGWIDDIGEGQGSTAEDMYENGNKIGIMN